ncbi:TetR/AcrR family transcriptional regulator [Pedococcus sp. 5OH_020]|uniref:TetR/AcrR family transcriptional regulator n=1 Tax=Pedococcus sp. 5OH_020 TaxID=2989814 RepID=UPI0022E9A879|nr:TetR/AcrR family transcriptional regulator [Pedococcus sp. 5OH_020]
MARKSERRHKQGEESRLAILDATLAIAAERGYDGTTVALVTERTGLPASSIYWHFGNKDKLLAATLEHSYREWRRTAPTWAPRADSGDLLERVEGRLQRGARALAQKPEFWSLGLMLALQQRVKEPAARVLYSQVRQETEDAVAGWWREVLEDDAVSADPALPQRLAKFYMMMMDGLFLQVRVTSARDVRRHVSLLARGLAGHLQATGLAS